MQQNIARGLPNFDTLVQNIAAGGGLALISGTVLGVAGGVVNILIFSFAALSLAYYWLIEATHFERLWLSLLPVGTRVRARDIWRNAEAAMGAYIRATVLALAVSALLLLTLYRVAGIPLRIRWHCWVGSARLFRGLARRSRCYRQSWWR